MLLVLEALLLILAALGQDHRAAVEGQTFPLNMAPDSVDDQYMGCRDDMVNKVEKEYLQKELKNPDFNQAWKKGENRFKKPVDNRLTRNHLIAIYVYTDSLVYEYFNKDARSGKENYKDKSYKWYSLQFYLTDAIQILKNQNKCITTYRGTKVTFDEDVKNKEVRFGSFASSSLKRERAKYFKTVSCFEIKTCQGAAVKEYSKLPGEEEVLIPPYETFKVTEIKKRDWCDTVFILESTGIKSDLNCALFKKK